MEFIHEKGDTYLIIGRTTNGRKFRYTYSNPMVAMAINLWQGRVWQVRNGKRKLLKTVFNW